MTEFLYRFLLYLYVGSLYFKNTQSLILSILNSH
nr:MAG TPA: hypothetical protein [Caudoviricetes sp.]